MTAALATVEYQRRELASAVKRLRVAVMTDPGRNGEFADALVGLVGNRLLAWSFTQAAVDAPESVVLSARILAERGPAGPYASADDAVRYFTAAAQLAAVQAGLGQADAAGRTVDSLDAWRGQLGRLPLVEQLDPQTVVWTLIARGRSLLAGDPAGANAHVEAALLRLYADRLDVEAEYAYLAVAAHLLAADARWAAGRADLALAHHRLALRQYRVVGVRAGEQLRPAVAEAAVAPLADLYEPFARRLETLGDQAGGIALRRAWVAELDQLDQPADTPAATAARTALAQALARAGRRIEAESLVTGLGEAEFAPERPGQPVDWVPLLWEQVLSTRPLTITATVRLRRDEKAAIAENLAARAEAEVTETGLRAEAERIAEARAAELAEAERRAAAEAAAEEARLAETERREAETLAARRAAEEAAAREAAERRRAELAAARNQARTVDPEVVSAAEAELPQARQQLLELAADAELSAQATAQERLARVLRPLAQADGTYAAELATSLDALVGLRWRLGDPEGSREAAKELKTWSS